MWDWDGLDLETGSVAGSTGNAAPPVVGPPAILGHPAGMRPNTTAAVAPNNEHGGGFTGLLGGLFNNSRTGSQRDIDAGLDDDDGFKRPQTSAAVMGHRDNQLRQQQQQQQTGGGGQAGGQAAGQWGFARQGSGQGGGLLPQGILKSQEPASLAAVGGSTADYQTGMGMGNLQSGQGGGQGRRPHTAHALRAPDGGSNGQGLGHSGVNDEDAHVVAGARAMMRYRNTGTRNSVDGGVPNGGGGQGMSGNNGNGPQTPGAQSAPGSSKNWNMGAGIAGGGGGAVQGGQSSGQGLGQGTGSKYPALGNGQGMAQGQVGGQGPGAGAAYTTSASNYNAAMMAQQTQQGRAGTAGAKPLGGSGSAQGQGQPAPPGGWVDQRPRSAASGVGILPSALPNGASSSNAAASNNNTLSYGSLKNRFLSGSSPSAAQGQGPQGQGNGMPQSQGGGQQYVGSSGGSAVSGGKTTASRIFGGLAR